MNIAALEQKKVSELHDIARGLGIAGFSDLRRRDLIYAILGAQATAQADAPAEGPTSAVADDRPPARRPTRRPEPARTPRRRSPRSRAPIADHWPVYMHGFDPYGVALEGLIRKVGVLEILPDGYGFLRSVEYGYLPSPDDIYVSPSQIKRFSLRVGDTVDGQVRPPKEGERFFALIRVHTVNGRSPDDVEDRTGYDFLTPAYPDQPLRLETTADALAARVVDFVAPIGKGQRGLVVAPPRSGRTVLLQALAAGAVANAPEATVLVVLLDGRPEDVVDFQRAVPGAEVIASTFDEAPERQVHVADLVLEKAKRLVEAGQDVVMVVDSLTSLARAHQGVAEGPEGTGVASSGAAAALRGPKRLFGAARAVEEGGSLTVIATVLAKTGAALDDAVYEGVHGTGNMELVLRRDLADAGLFPAIDLAESGTRREEILVAPEQLARLRAARQRLAGLDAPTALAALLDGLRATDSNDAYLEDTGHGA